MKKILTILAIISSAISFAQNWVDVDGSINVPNAQDLSSSQVLITNDNQKFLVYEYFQGGEMSEVYLKKYNEVSKSWDDAVSNPFAYDITQLSITEHNGKIVIGYFDEFGLNSSEYLTFILEGSNLNQIGTHYVEDYRKSGVVVSNNTGLFVVTAGNGETDRNIEIFKYEGTPSSWTNIANIGGSLINSFAQQVVHATNSYLWILAPRGTAGVDSLDLYKVDANTGSYNTYAELEEGAQNLRITGTSFGYPTVGYEYGSEPTNFMIKSVNIAGTQTIADMPTTDLYNLSLSFYNNQPNVIFEENVAGDRSIKINQWDGSTWNPHPYGAIESSTDPSFGINEANLFSTANRQIIVYSTAIMAGAKSGATGLQIRMTNDAPLSTSYTTKENCENTYNVDLSDDFKVSDVDMDSTYLFVSGTTSNETILSGTNISFVSPPYSPTATSRTFTINAGSFGGFGNVIVPIGITDGYDTTIVNVSFDVKEIPTITNTLPGGLDLCINGDLYDLNSVFTPAGGVFSGEGVDGHYFDPAFDFEMFGEFNIDYNYTGANGCSNFAAISPNVFEVEPISVSSTNSACSSADGTAEVFTGGQNGPYELYWSTGATSSSIQNLFPGVYYINVQDINNCMAVQQVNIQATNIAIAEDITFPTCFGDNDGAIDLTVTGNGPFEFLWSTGDSTEDLTNLVGGNYFVTITDASGCVSTANYEVLEPGKLKFGYSAYDGSCEFGFGGDLSIFDESGGSGTYTYWWNDGSLSGSYNMYVVPGTYQFVLQDDEGCVSDTAIMTTSSYDAPIITGQTMNSNCNSNDGSIQITIDSNGQSINSILWSNGATTEDLTNLSPGNYSVVVTTDLGCNAYYSTTVNAIKPLQNDICVVTVDSVTTTNLVVWEPEQTTGIDHYNIYREGPVAGDYIKIAEKSVDNLSQYIDLAASPEVRSWRYKISATDECGIEGPQSLHHKTIHVVYTENAGVYTITWDDYEGFDYPTFYLERRDAINTNWVPVGQGPSTSYFSDTDTPGTVTGLDYRVSVDAPGTCQATKANDYNSSRSNRSSGIFSPDDVDPLGLTDLVLDYDIKVYPNPANNQFGIVVEGAIMTSMVIKNLNGQIVSSDLINGYYITKDISSLASGIYLVEVETEKGKSIHKLIKK